MRCGRGFIPAIVAGVVAVPGGAKLGGQPAPSFSLRKLGGGRLALRELRGKPVLLAFWRAG